MSKNKIVVVRKHFQKIKYVGTDKYWRPVLLKKKLCDMAPLGHKVYLEFDKHRICTKIIDLTMMFGDMPFKEIKNTFRKYEVYQSDLGYHEGEEIKDE